MEGRKEMNVGEYLSRIGVDPASVRVDEATLRLLQRQHLLSVPFENLDIHWKRPITIDTAKFYDKIVVERRGGFCYELNGLFNDLLRELGFQTRLVSARVFNGSEFGPEFDHAAIIVTIGELEYLADVGFGDFTAEPLRFVADLEQQDREGAFVIRRAEFGSLEVARKTDNCWTTQYKFTSLGRDLSEFAEMCDFQQYSPESHFTKGKVCSLMTGEGRKTLTDSKYVVTTRGQKRETAISSEQEFTTVLLSEFGISREEAAVA
jgi:N-hydroxyarylamine O-acetyltransferase